VYEPNDSGQYADGMLIRANPMKLAGYRLPTEAEWELDLSRGEQHDLQFWGTRVVAGTVRAIHCQLVWSEPPGWIVAAEHSWTL